MVNWWHSPGMARGWAFPPICHCLIFRPQRMRWQPCHGSFAPPSWGRCESWNVALVNSLKCHFYWIDLIWLVKINQVILTETVMRVCYLAKMQSEWVESVFHPWPHKHPLNELESSRMGQKSCISNLLQPLDALLLKLRQKEVIHNLYVLASNYTIEWTNSVGQGGIK